MHRCRQRDRQKDRRKKARQTANMQTVRKQKEGIRQRKDRQVDRHTEKVRKTKRR